MNAESEDAKGAGDGGGRHDAGKGQEHNENVAVKVDECLKPARQPSDNLVTLFPSIYKQPDSSSPDLIKDTSPLLDKSPPF